MLGKRRWPEGGSDSANSAATTPRSAASTPGGATSSRPRLGPPEDGPPEEEEEDDGPRELAFAADMEEVPIPVRGQVVEVCSRKTNTAGRLWCEVRSASDLRGPTTWVHAVHVRPLTTLTSGARHAGTTRRRLESNPDDWPPLREPGPSDRRPSGAAQSSSGGHRRTTVDATATRHTHSPLDDAHVAQLLQGGLDEGQSPTSAQTCAYETTHCLPTTRTCNHPSCSLLVCDTCAESMCPDGENENQWHWCAHHMPPTEQQDDEGDSDEDPFAFKAT